MRMVVSSLVVLLMVLLLLAYFTMLERKVLGYGQMRKGPNKVMFLGLGQPLVDGVKLMMKTFLPLKGSLVGMYMIMPIGVFMVMMAMWLMVLSVWGVNLCMYFMLALMVLVGVMLVLVFLLSVFSGSKYGVIGAMRGLAQMVSYEILMGLVLILIFMEGFSYSINSSGLLVYHIPVLFVWWMVCVVETNRSPVDFMEGESELVSGFNVEFSSVLFAMLFLGEYGVMSFYSVVTVYLFMGWGGVGVSMLLSLFIILMFIWWRLTYPRYRYDLLMSMSWGVMLPLLLVMFISSSSLVGMVG
nr:NADH dehydrogenase subunit 1 [Moniliformis sp. XH-2020]